MHVDPNAFYIYVGKDSLNSKFVGSFRGINAEFGSGAYRETLISSLPNVNDKTEK